MHYEHDGIGFFSMQKVEESRKELDVNLNNDNLNFERESNASVLE